MTAEPKTTRSRKATTGKRTKTASAPRKTSTTRSSRKTAAAPDKATTAAKPDRAADAAPPVAETPVVVKEVPVVSDTPEMKRQELIAKVMERVDTKKKDAKPVVDALLAVLGEALAEGRELNLNPLGKVKLNRVKETGNGRIMIAKIRQPRAAASASGADGSQRIAPAPKVEVAQDPE